MTSGPIILRELRSEARAPATHRTRLFAAALLVALMIGAGLREGITPTLGKPLFLLFHTTVYVLIWVLVPLLLHDSISRERREGTLGLLLLTPLTGAGVILAKAFIGLLRSSGILLAVVPVLALPVLIGGVSAAEVIRAVLIEIMALLGATAAALLASTFSVQRQRALLASALWCVVFMGVLAGVQLVLLGGLRGRDPDFYSNPFNLLTGILGGGFSAVTRVDIYAAPLWMTLGSVGLAVGLLIAVLVHAGVRLKELANASGPSKRQQKLFKTFCTPLIMGAYLKRQLGTALNRNPIGWLQQRRWTSRLSQWGWVAVLLVATTWALTGTQRSLFGQLTWLAALLGANLCLSAAGSFRDERQSGALELLMVAPLTGREILLGRLRGLWRQFFLPLLLWSWIWWYVGSIHQYAGYYRWAFVWQGGWLLAGVAFVVLPVIGIHQSFLCRTLLGAWIKTMILGLLLPWIVAGISGAVMVWLAYVTTGDPSRVNSLAGTFVWTALLIWLGSRSFAAVVELLDQRKFNTAEAR